MALLKIDILPALTDNYIFLLVDDSSGKTATIDPSEAKPVLDFLKTKNIQLDFILNTHHHADHTGGNLELQRMTGCQIVGGKKDAHRIPGINLQLSDQEIFKFGAMNATILEVPGHTLGAIAYFFESEEALFTGDTLFSLGCGRLFEGTAEQMFSSLNKIKSLPPKTQIYCGHEYTEKNCRFALSLDPESQKLKDFHKRILARREENRPTLPAILADELRLNPFLNCDLQQFKERRRLRDQF